MCATNQTWVRKCKSNWGSSRMCVRVCVRVTNQNCGWIGEFRLCVRACMYACAPHNEREARELGLWDVRFNRVFNECSGDLPSSLIHHFGRARNMRSCVSSSATCNKNFVLRDPQGQEPAGRGGGRGSGGERSDGREGEGVVNHRFSMTSWGRPDEKWRGNDHR